MFDLINKVLFYIKVILLLLTLTLTLYILLAMNDYYGNEIVNLILICLPLLLVLIIFTVSFIFKDGDNNLFFNIASFIALIAILIIDLRAILDKNMVLWIRGNLNFYYFQNQMMQIKILSYCIFVGNVLVIYNEKYNKKIINKKNEKSKK